MAIFNILALVGEVLYYSIFMKNAKNEGNFYKYVLLFIMISFAFYFIGTNKIYSYLVLSLTIVYGMKYIVRTKISLYDLLVIFIMILAKVMIELPIYIILFKILHPYAIGFILGFLKAVLAYTLKNKIQTIFKKLKSRWDNNNFYIRYIFSILLYAYIIITILLLTLFPM